VLLPKSDELKKHVREVRVLLDEPPANETTGSGKAEKNGADNRDKHAYGVVRQVEVTDADGDRTVVVFKEIRTNTGLKDHDLELTVPEGTRTSHPLEGGSPQGPERKDRR